MLAKCIALTTAIACAWQVLDLKRFLPTRELQDGLLWVVEQLPGMVEAADMTHVGAVTSLCFIAMCMNVHQHDPADRCTTVNIAQMSWWSEVSAYRVNCNCRVLWM